MDYGLHNSAKEYLNRHKLNKNRNRLLIFLGCIIALCVTYALIVPAITQERDTFCGYENHSHDSDCYELVLTDELVCTLEEDENHIHDEECYKELILACNLKEHTHELICYSNKNADLETEETWTSSVASVELSGNKAEDLVAIAKSQIGYLESTKNFIVLEDGESIKGYTRYGAWYGDPYADWSSTFVGFCLKYAKVSDSTIPFSADLDSFITALQNKGIYVTASEYIPSLGDLVFFDHDLNASVDHVGIITGISKDNTEITVIEGDKDNAVVEQTWSQIDNEIVGFGMLPRKEQLPVEGDYSQQTIKAVIYTDETYKTVATDDKTSITVSGILPQNATAKAFKVELEDAAINGERLIVAYDIVVFDENGNPFEECRDGEKLKVIITPEKWDEVNNDDENYNIYYIPEIGNPEVMKSKADDNAISFITDHFTVYALTAKGSLSTVYLNGVSGKDTNSGNSSNNAVKTIEKAVELVKENGTVMITGTVTITGELELDVDNTVVFKRDITLLKTTPMITVANGGSLKLADVTLDGGCNEPNSQGNIGSTTTYASPNNKNTPTIQAPIIVVNTGGNLEICDGTIIEKNSNRPKSVTTSGYVGQGGAIYCQGNMTMTGGIIRKCEALSGGGIYIESANENRITFDLSGGEISYNYAREIVTASVSDRTDPYHKNAGGGVYVGDYVTMNMSGGTISYNQSAREGGGISLGWLNRKKNSAIYEFITTFNMTGGTFTQNIATSTGGGLNVTAGREAYIMAGTFTHNTARGQEYQPSSGTSVATVYSGGAIYLDAKQHDAYGNYAGKPGYAKINRVLIADNTADWYGGGIATCNTSSGTVNASLVLDGTLIYNNTATLGGQEMYLNGDTSLVGNKMLGGGTYNWTKSGSYYDNDLTSNSQSVKDGLPLVTVWITDNYAGVDGGGIGCNGEIEIGGEPDTQSIAITKVWKDAEGVDLPEYIVVQLYKDGAVYGDPIKIYKKQNPDIDENWDTYYIDGLPSRGVFTIKEVKVPGFDSVIKVDGNHFTVTNTYKGTSISVEKRWSDGTPGTSGVTVQLLQNGKAFKDPVVLNDANNWFYIWKNLPACDADNNAYDYTVKEFAIDGYSASIEADKTGPTTTVITENKWEEANTLEAGKTYLLVASNGALASSGSSNLTWVNVSDNLSAGTLPDDAALWTYSNSKLKNGIGKYLYYYNSSYYAYSSGSNISYLNNTLSVNSGGYTRYIYYSNGSFTNTTKSSQATKFSLYTLTQKQITETENKGDIHYVITNTKAYQLPETGGIGTKLFYMVGAILAFSAIAFIITRKRMDDFTE